MMPASLFWTSTSASALVMSVTAHTAPPGFTLRDDPGLPLDIKQDQGGMFGLRQHESIVVHYQNFAVHCGYPCLCCQCARYELFQSSIVPKPVRRGVLRMKCSA